MQNYLQDNDYNIIDNEGGGDCLFAVIRDGLSGVGEKVTIEELRNKLANDVDEETFLQYKLNYDIITPFFFIITSFLLISKFPTYSFKKIVIPRRTTIFLLFGIVLFFGLLLIYTFNVIALSAVIYVLLLPISFLHYQKIKKQHENDRIQDEDDLEDIL